MLRMAAVRNLGIALMAALALRCLSKQTLLPDEAMPGMSGYISLTNSSKMFYAFYEATDPDGPLHDTPVILWLQGGPGCSSMTGNFYEIGPWRISPDLNLHKNDYPWNHKFGLLFLDNPVGAGYSIATNDDDIPDNEEQVSHDLHLVLLQFFQHVLQNSQRVLFIAGESYAGKYVPALAYRILMKQKRRKLAKPHSSKGNEAASPLLQLGGVIIGNGLTDPEIQVQTHAEVCHAFGLIDLNQKQYVNEQAMRVVGHIHKQEWYEAHRVRSALMDWIESTSGIATLLDIRRGFPYHSFVDGKDFLGRYLNKRSVKLAMRVHEEAEWVPCNHRVRRVMANDTMKSAKWMVERVVAEVPVLLFQGQYDVKDGVVSTEEWVRTLKWKGINEFLSTERSLWRVNDKHAGYWKSFANLTNVVVIGAGHMVPADQGLHSQYMVESWITQQLVQGHSSLYSDIYDVELI